MKERSVLSENRPRLDNLSSCEPREERNECVVHQPQHTDVRMNVCGHDVVSTKNERRLLRRSRQFVFSLSLSERRIGLTKVKASVESREIRQPMIGRAIGVLVAVAVFALLQK